MLVFTIVLGWVWEWVCLRQFIYPVSWCLEAFYTFRQQKQDRNDLTRKIRFCFRKCFWPRRERELGVDMPLGIDVRREGFCGDVLLCMWQTYQPSATSHNKIKLVKFIHMLRKNCLKTFKQQTNKRIKWVFIVSLLPLAFCLLCNSLFRQFFLRFFPFHIFYHLPFCLKYFSM